MTIISAGTMNDIAFLTYDQQLLARATVSQAVRYTQRSVLQGSVMPLPGDATDNLQCRATTCAPHRSRASCARGSTPTRHTSLRCSIGFMTNPTSTR